MTATTETQTFRAIWPIVNNDAAGATNEELLQLAFDDLPAVAQRHRVKIDGQPRGYITEAAKIPGSGGTGHVVVVEASATPKPKRAYWRAES
ncbi:hypothetical protein ACX800_09900 [Paenarthrobacter nitroguajacolicus]|uniref:hypothetical protein n=1 Tax=Paenarthrobacter nitroguajacolicus TaxID=211146 RepID=UPI003D1D61B4